MFTTDPQLQSGKYVVLTDPKHVFGFQNVALIVKQSVLAAEGPAFAQTINKVTQLLTLPAIIAMNAAVELDQQSPAAVAHPFLSPTTCCSDRDSRRPAACGLAGRRPVV